MSSKHIAFTSIFLLLLVLPCQGMAQQNSKFKPLSTLESSQSEKTKPSSLGFAIALAGDFGLGLHERADVRNNFVGGGAVGFGILLKFVQLKHLRFGLNLGIMHFAHTTNKGTAAVKVASKMNRLTSLAGIEFYRKAFFVNGQIGAGFMLLSVDSTLIQNDVVHKSSNTGFDPGVMTAIEIGMELGQHFFHWSREARLAFHTDWIRHDERDEIVMFMQISIGLYSTFSNK